MRVWTAWTQADTGRTSKLHTEEPLTPGLWLPGEPGWNITTVQKTALKTSLGKIQVKMGFSKRFTRNFHDENKPSWHKSFKFKVKNNTDKSTLRDLRMSVRLSQTSQTEQKRAAVTTTARRRSSGKNTPVALAGCVLTWPNGSAGRALTCERKIGSRNNKNLFSGWVMTKEERSEEKSWQPETPRGATHRIVCYCSWADWSLTQFPLGERRISGPAKGIHISGFSLQSLRTPSGGLQMKPFCCEATALATAPPCCSSHARQTNPDLSSPLRCNGDRGYF